MNKVIEDIKNCIENADRFDFSSKSMENSEMNWNYRGTGEIVEKKMTGKKTDENMAGFNEVYFFEEITLEGGMKLTDRKMWKIQENRISFFHFRNNRYEEIFSFSGKNGQAVMEKEYRCSPDLYSAKLKTENGRLYFQISIAGKRKNEEIGYIYYKEGR